jgi:hypothetical protein
MLKAMLSGLFSGLSLIIWSFRTFVCWAWKEKGAFTVELVATLLGVFIAIQHSTHLQQQELDIASRQQQEHLHNLTIQRLHLVVKEAEYNSKVVDHVLETFSKGSPERVVSSQTDRSLAIAALSDPNVVSVLTPVELKVLLECVEAHAKLDHNLRLYKDMLLGGRVDSETKEGASAAITENAILTAAICDTLREELQAYSDERRFDQQELESAQETYREREEYYRKKYEYQQEGE